MPGEASGKMGDLFLLMGTALGRDAKDMDLGHAATHQRDRVLLPEASPRPGSAQGQTAPVFSQVSGISDPLLATDAYSEFAKANYDDLVLIKDALPREKIRNMDPKPRHLGLAVGPIRSDARHLRR